MAEKISPSAKKLKLDVVQKPPPRRPNAFVAIPFDDSNIKSKIKQVQEIITQKEPKLSKACVPIDKSHITLLVFYTENIEKIVEVLTPVLNNYEFPLPEIKVKSLGHFRHQVLYAELEENSKNPLNILRQKIQDTLVENDIEGIGPKDDFKSHLTIMKLSRMKYKSVRKIDPKLHQDLKDFEFGIQPVKEIQVLSMTKPIQPNGYYHCEHSFPVKLPTQKNLIRNNSTILILTATLLAFAYIKWRR